MLDSMLCILERHMGNKTEAWAVRINSIVYTMTAVYQNNASII